MAGNRKSRREDLRRRRQGSPGGDQGSQAGSGGWPGAVVARHLQCAAGLDAAGVTFRGLDRPDQRVVESMVREHIAGAGGFSYNPKHGGVLAVDADQRVIGALIVGRIETSLGFAALLTHVVVTPGWQGRGVGTVLLGLIPQVFEMTGTGPPAMTFGTCSESASRFYRSAGFMVLAPGVPLPFPVGDKLIGMGNENTVYSCWFYRDW